MSSRAAAGRKRLKAPAAPLSSSSNVVASQGPSTRSGNSYPLLEPFPDRRDDNPQHLLGLKHGFQLSQKIQLYHLSPSKSQLLRSPPSMDLAHHEASQSVESFSFPASRPESPLSRDSLRQYDSSHPSSTSPTPTTGTSFASLQSHSTALSSMYPSPPTSAARLSPSPSITPVDAPNRNRPGSGSGSQSSGMDSQLSLNPRAKENKSSSSSSGSQRASFESDGPFIFPSSRSRAVPSMSGGPPRFRFQSKKRKERERAEAIAEVGANMNISNLTAPGPSILTASGPSSPNSCTVTFAETPLPPRVQPLRRPPKLPSPSSSTGAAPFVYPSSRSRAHPKKVKPPKSPTSSLSDSTSSGSTRFMGIRLSRKRKSTSSFDSSKNPSSPRSAETRVDELGSSSGESASPLQEHERNRAATLHQSTKVGTYPLDPYDTTLLECDRQTGELVKRLNGTGTPSFYPYGTSPPATILDMGCGQGEWLLDAAIAWKGYGARVVGVDMVDITKNMRSLALKKGVSDNVNFVKVNFLKKQLPFPDESFDLVRMSCLTYAISFNKWEFVLKEACRVLTVGGRLELIDDHIFFAYGKPPMSPIPPNVSPPRLDIPIPSSRISTIGPPPASSSSASDSDAENWRTGASHSRQAGEFDNSELYALYEDEAETATIGPQRDSLAFRSPTYLRTSAVASSIGTPSMIQSISDSWDESFSSAEEVESLFENMMNNRYGIHLCPSEFVVSMMENIFGHAREVETMHLMLAAPSNDETQQRQRSRSSDSKRPDSVDRRDTSPSSASLEASHPLQHSPGLILLPSTFIPMHQAELESHALKHHRVLLSTKPALTQYAVDVSGEEDADDEGIMEALWDYENFLQQRFDPPAFSTRASTDSSSASSLVDDMDHATIGPRSRARSMDSSSIFSVSSVTTEARAAMWEYQSDLRGRFVWPPDESPGVAASSLFTTRAPAAPTVAQGTRGSCGPPSPTISTLPPSFHTRRLSTVSEIAVNAPPPHYSRFEPTHVRTFHIYEAIKMGDEVGALATRADVGR